MNTIEIIGLSATAILTIVGLVKMELIREFVKKIVSDKEKVNLAAIVLLIVVAIIPSIIGFSVPSGASSSNVSETNILPQKTKEEMILQGVQVGLEKRRN